MSNITPLNGNQNGQQHPQQIPVTPEDLTFAECSCGSIYFRQAVKIGKLSKVHPKNITGETKLVTVPVNLCAGCGKELDLQKLAE